MNDRRGIAELGERYWVVAVALAVEVVEEAQVGVGVPAFVVGGVVAGTILDVVLLLQGAGGSLEGTEELLEGAAVLDVFGSPADLVLIVPFVHLACNKQYK